MGPRRTGTIEPYTDTTGKTRHRARLRLGDGSRPRFDVPEGYSEARAREWAAAMQEQEDARGGVLKAKQAARANQDTARMRESHGGAFESRGSFFMRVTVAPQQRRAELLAWCTSVEAAKERAVEVQALVNRLRTAGRMDLIEKLVESSATADADEMATLARTVDGIVTKLKPEPVVELFGEKLRVSEAARLLGLSQSEVAQALERGVWRRYFESVLSRIVRLSRENEALKSRVAELEARTGDGVDYLRLEDLLERVGGRRFTHLIGVEPTRACELSRLARERQYRADWVQAELDKVASPGKRRVHCDA